MAQGEVTTRSGEDLLDLADWRREVSQLYADVRAMSETSPAGAWRHWVAVREALFRHHPQSPVPADRREAFTAQHWEYDRDYRFEVAVEPAVPAPAGGGLQLPNSGDEAPVMSRVGVVEVPFPAGPRRLSMFWIAGYAGGLFLPFRDATNGTETYPAGRYVLDTAKGADLGGDLLERRLVLDFNFAYQPSCAFDPRWACPLAPPENRLDIVVPVGERIA